MEIYVNGIERTVSHITPAMAVGNVVDVTVWDNDTLKYTVPTVTYDDNVYSFEFPLSLSNKNTTYRVNWQFDYLENSANKHYETDTVVDIVTPLVEVEIARVELEIPLSISDEKVRLTERRVRRVIEEATGSVFAPLTTSLYATELPDGSIRLPRRLISLTSVGGVENTLYYVLANGGWALAIVYPRKRDGIRAGEVPITDPFAIYRKPHSTKVLVTGLWGWEAVPSDIKEAALILMEQYLCPDAIYAERYLKTMTAADFRFEFAPGAYVGTGNVIADHLLFKYTMGSAAVI